VGQMLNRKRRIGDKDGNEEQQQERGEIRG
jgi:hypothetical protein